MIQRWSVLLVIVMFAALLPSAALAAPKPKPVSLVDSVTISIKTAEWREDLGLCMFTFQADVTYTIASKKATHLQVSTVFTQTGGSDVARFNWPLAALEPDGSITVVNLPGGLNPAYTSDWEASLVDKRGRASSAVVQTSPGYPGSVACPGTTGEVAWYPAAP